MTKLIIKPTLYQSQSLSKQRSVHLRCTEVEASLLLRKTYMKLQIKLIESIVVASAVNRC